jgi:hypothetical protein
MHGDGEQKIFVEFLRFSNPHPQISLRQKRDKRRYEATSARTSQGMKAILITNLSALAASGPSQISAISESAKRLLL